jgi:hypothetical protein
LCILLIAPGLIKSSSPKSQVYSLRDNKSASLIDFQGGKNLSDKRNLKLEKFSILTSLSSPLSLLRKTEKLDVSKLFMTS